MHSAFGIVLLVAILVFSPWTASQANRLVLPEETGHKAAQPDEKPASGGASLMALADLRVDAQGAPLSIPKNAQDTAFLAGDWKYDRIFRSSDGEELKADFHFDKNGRGYGALIDSNNIQHMAQAIARMEGDALRITTSPFTSLESGKVFNAESIECRNGGMAAECAGTDGISRWEGGRLLKSDAPAPALAESAAPVASDGAYIELSSDGAELSPVILENREKARSASGKPTLADLAGDWQYSHDLARRDDGRSLGLQFHFDREGNGYSVITDDQGNSARAEAEASITPQGSIRVKTEAYKGAGGEGYFPTFMECRAGEPDYLCDVSNGWARLADGKLVSMQESAQERQVAERSPSASESAAGKNALAAGPAAKEEEGASIQIPEEASNMNFLAGKWRCNTGLARASDNSPVVLEFTFNEDGKGRAVIREQSGKLYTASATGSLRNRILRINTSQFKSRESPQEYHKAFIECMDQGSRAICSGENGGIKWSNATFTRIQ